LHSKLANQAVLLGKNRISIPHFPSLFQEALADFQFGESLAAKTFAKIT
jgi:hypothetical protein